MLHIGHTWRLFVSAQTVIRTCQNADWLLFILFRSRSEKEEAYEYGRMRFWKGLLVLLSCLCKKSCDIDSLSKLLKIG